MAKKKATKGTRASRSRRGKGEGVTGKKAGETEVRQVGADLKIANGEKIVHYLKAVKGTKERIGTIQGQLRNIYKQAKAEAKQAAKSGRGPECKFAEGSDAYDAYMEAYAEVQSGMVPGADKLTDEERASAIAAGRSASQPEMALQ